MKKVLVITNTVLTVFAIMLVASTTYAFFTASVNGNNLASNNVITTGHMEVIYTDGNVIGSTEKIMPGDSIEKHFRVTNTGTIDSAYDIYLNDVINYFNTKTDLVYELISETGSNKSETTCPDANTKIASSNIGVGVTHDYTLKITYKNVDRNQDDNKGKGFRFKIDLVEKEVDEKTIANKLEDLKTQGATDLEYDGVDTLGENGTPDNNLRYVGATPNNYIYFNCSTTNVNEMNDTTCEKWRIIGLMNNIEDEKGNSSSRVKIMRDEILGNYSWDTSVDDINKGTGINQWGESTYEDGTTYEGADLMRELNTDYLGNITVGTDGKWYSSWKNQKNFDMPTTTLNSIAQSMIETVKWKTGATDGNQFLYTAKNVYNYERSENSSKMCTNGNYCTDTVNRTTSWTGKVALMYSSDYGYSTSGGSTLDKGACLNTLIIYWHEEHSVEGISDCIQNSWIYDKNYSQWTLSTIGYNSLSNSQVIDIQGDELRDGLFAYNFNEVRPALYLKNNVKIASGDGTSDNPYKLVQQ